MITAILAGALAIGAVQQQIDTTFAVRAGGELHLEAVNGTVTIGTWDRAAIRVRTGNTGALDIDTDDGGSSVSIEPVRPTRGTVTFDVTVPRTFDVNVEGLNVQVTIDGTRGSVDVENVNGAVVVRGVTGAVSAESASGSISIENVTGDMSVSTVNQAITITRSRGRVEAETVNGSIVMRDVVAASVHASTVNGLVEYSGTIQDGGRYFLATHNGAITMAIPEQASASVSVDAHNGRVETAFPVRVGRSGDRQYNFTLGSGSARIELESYNGTINLVRPRGR